MPVFGTAPAHAERPAKRHEFRIALDIGDKLEHMRRAVLDMAAGLILRHEAFPGRYLVCSFARD
jgi:hypothetical protein